MILSYSLSISAVFLNFSCKLRLTSLGRTLFFVVYGFLTHFWTVLFFFSQISKPLFDSICQKATTFFLSAVNPALNGFYRSCKINSLCHKIGPLSRKPTNVVVYTNYTIHCTEMGVTNNWIGLIQKTTSVHNQISSENIVISNSTSA